MINIPKGTKDVLPTDSYRWHYVEKKFRDVAALFGFFEVRTPTFEHTELFLRGVGETTDIVNKEMYTFFDKGERSITLKPEGTAGVARAYVENGLSSLPQPVKMYYITSVFRYEKPQAGRLREHHQFGVEIFGSNKSYADIEAILVADTFFKSLGISNLSLKINNIGCPKCRVDYYKVLKNYLNDNYNSLCDVCKSRFEKNPLRILDCKEKSCTIINSQAPKCTDFLCDECKSQKNSVETSLENLGILYENDPHMVRGLDYYTGTVFEFVSANIGAQGTVCGGGRYNNLVQQIGGQDTPAVGFGMGIERLMLLMDALNCEVGKIDVPLIYVAPINDLCYNAALKLVQELRQNKISAEIDVYGRGLKSQLKYANKKGFKYLIVIGEEERASLKYTLKDMDTGEENIVDKDSIAEIIRR